MNIEYDTQTQNFQSKNTKFIYFFRSFKNKTCNKHDILFYFKRGYVPIQIKKQIKI